MTTTLQEALLKAGLIKKKEAEKKTENKAVVRKGPGPRETFNKQEKPGFLEGKHHHHIRTECDACRRSGPDVEYYEHSNRMLNAKWLCLRCADTNKVHDNSRQTMQSQFASSGKFLREYGPTKVFK